jgi:hypothetical protein
MTSQPEIHPSPTDAHQVRRVVPISSKYSAQHVAEAGAPSPVAGVAPEAEEAKWAEFGGKEPYVNEHVVAAFLGFEPRHVLELARAGIIPSHPFGRKRKTWRFRLSEVEASLSSQDLHPAGSMQLAGSRTKERNRLG